jgi:hypothetical protein
MSNAKLPLNFSHPPFQNLLSSEAWSIVMTELGRWEKSDLEVENSSARSEFQKIEAYEKTFVDTFLRLSQVFLS